MASVVGFRCNDKPALPPAGMGEYLPVATPPPALPSAPPELCTGRGREESFVQVDGHLLAPMFGGKGRELESRAWLLYLGAWYCSGPEGPMT